MLSASIGGVNFSFVAAGLFLVWLYCMSLAFATLWVSLYLNELVAAIFVIGVATFLNIIACMRSGFLPVVLSPFSVLLHPVYTSAPTMGHLVEMSVLPKLISCTLGMSFFICVCAAAIYLGPLYGIIRENSMFGEVIRDGDSKRKRWSRFRPHIRRSSEITFFYANRSRALMCHEGFIRWCFGFGSVLLISTVAYSVFAIQQRLDLLYSLATPDEIWIKRFHGNLNAIYGITLAFSALIFSHTKNTTFLRIPFLLGKRIEVSMLDTFFFLVTWIVATVSTIAVACLFDLFVMHPMNQSLFGMGLSYGIGANGTVDFSRICIEGTVVVSISGLVVYVFHRLLCLGMWLRTGSFLLVASLYWFTVGLIPVLFGQFVLENGFGNIVIPANIVIYMSSTSPIAGLAIVYQFQLGPQVPEKLTTIPFYVLHLILLLLGLWQYRNASQKVRTTYLPESPQEPTND